MYKKQIKPTKTSGSVIKLKKNIKKPNSAKSAESVGINQRNESAETSKDNEKLSHFHKDVPEHVQEFIKRISSVEPQPDESKREKSVSPSQPTPWKATEDISCGESTVQVIVTTEYSPNYLTNSDYDKLKEDTRFTEFEIVQLWQTFKRDFPNGRINKNQLREMIKMIFPRGNVPDLFIENIFRVFDPRYNGFIRFTDLLIAFSMSMKGTVTEKLHWAFKLYDKDGNGEIDREEMEEIFSKLCSLVQCERTAEDRAREREAERRKLLLATKIKIQAEETSQFKLLSKKLVNRSRRMESSRKKKKCPEKTKLRKSKSESSSVCLSVQEDDSWSTDSSELHHSARSGRLSMDSGVSLDGPGLCLASETKDPDRDCTNFDPIERARDLFSALDVDGDGVVTETEFISGCLKDQAFILMLERFGSEDIWRGSH